MPDRNIYVYVDETGDPGAPGPESKASPIFGMACLLVPEARQVALRDAIQRLRDDFNIPDSSVFSWKSHLATHEKRKHAAAVLGAVSDIRVLYVYADKSAITGQYVQERGLFYNYVAGKAYKSILWAARNWAGGSAKVHTRFGHVRGFDHGTTKAYFERVLTPDSKVPTWLEAGLKWVSATQYRESEAADIYAGFMKAAVWPDAFGAIEGGYLMKIWHQVRVGPDGCRIPLGFMSMPSNEVARQLEWWSCGCEACA